MSAIKNAVVIGGGFSGMAAAIRMLRAGTRPTTHSFATWSEPARWRSRSETVVAIATL